MASDTLCSPHCTPALSFTLISVPTETGLVGVPTLGKAAGSRRLLPLPSGWRLEPGSLRAAGGPARRRLPGNALFVGVGGGAGAR